MEGEDAIKPNHLSNLGHGPVWFGTMYLRAYVRREKGARRIRGPAEAIVPDTEAGKYIRWLGTVHWGKEENY